jgi:hypothetical protein
LLRYLVRGCGHAGFRRPADRIGIERGGGRDGDASQLDGRNSAGDVMLIANRTATPAMAGRAICPIKHVNITLGGGPLCLI